ncbi:MAG: carbohydrate ABC transporter permease [Ruminococcaceae bacterium]|nr:carbohydrate ABC transporter permease [Oscillospiraceae bacterium]
MTDQKFLVFEKNIEREKSRQRVMRILVQVFLYLFLIIMALIIVFPFYFMLISSVKELAEYRLPQQTLWPNKIVFHNYVEAFHTANLGTLFSNTLYVGLVSTALSLVITVITAFAFARLEFKGKNAMFAALLATMMIPGELFTITNYQTVSDFLGFRTLGRELGSGDLIAMGDWKNTFTVLIVPFLVSVFYIYLLRQNFLQIPNELYLAAKVDGTSDIKYLWKVMIPLALPTLISITILKMMGAWNSYMWPQLVANDEAHRLITNGLRNAFTTTSGDVNIPVQMAAVAIVSAPLFLVFIFLRKYIMKGVSRSGIKG